MFRCIGRIGCLMLLALLALVAWLTRDWWMPRVLDRHASVASAPAPVWEPVTDAGASRATATMARLNDPRAPATASVSAADAASYIFKGVIHAPREITDSMQAMAVGNRLALRASVPSAALGDAGLGPFAAVLRDREPVELIGTARGIGPAAAIFQVQELKFRGITLPRALVPKLIRQIARGRPSAAGSATRIPDDAFAFAIPPNIGDIRVVNGRVVLYKALR